MKISRRNFLAYPALAALAPYIAKGASMLEVLPAPRAFPSAEPELLLYLYATNYGPGSASVRLYSQPNSPALLHLMVGLGQTFTYRPGVNETLSGDFYVETEGGVSCTLAVRRGDLTLVKTKGAVIQVMQLDFDPKKWQARPDVTSWEINSSEVWS